MMTRASATMALSQHDDEGVRTVSLWHRDGSIVIQEYLVGVGAQRTYGYPTYTHQVVVKPLCIAAFAFVLGVEPTQLDQAVVRYFRIAPYRRLSDLMDYLDLNDVPFDYLAADREGGVYRPGIE